MQVKPSRLFRLLTPLTELGYNADDDLIQVKKTFFGITWLRTITDPDITDDVINKWVTYSDWVVQ